MLLCDALQRPNGSVKWQSKMPGISWRAWHLSQLRWSAWLSKKWGLGPGVFEDQNVNHPWERGLQECTNSFGSDRSNVLGLPWSLQSVRTRKATLQELTFDEHEFDLWETWRQRVRFVGHSHFFTVADPARCCTTLSALSCSWQSRKNSEKAEGFFYFCDKLLQELWVFGQVSQDRSSSSWIE